MPKETELDKANKRAEEWHNHFVLAAQSLRDEQGKNMQLKNRLAELEVRLYRTEQALERMEKRMDIRRIEKMSSGFPWD